MAERSPDMVQVQLRLQGGHPYLSVAVDEDAILAMARKIVKKRFKRLSKPLEEVALVEDYLTHQLGNREQEVFACLFLDQQHRLITYRELFFGSISQANIHPREIIKVALQSNAAAIIAVHNHPSGNPKPSAADIEITREIKDALALVEIRLLDHFIVAGLQMVSLQQLGKC